MTQRIVVLITVLVACSAASAQKVNSSPCRTHAQSETSAWRVYEDLGYHFCFRYPRSYKPVARPKNLCRKPVLRD